ncbi:MAG: endo-1,4-beta-xylanase [Defluviitaleaceae bacterium]|nr:endo-1,4-beta-xylanase [Defluviitaleaceae bacterium]MCL2835565.1 endo-1,4-beta-xylanase [Defluviitaleaceae bacterium]
MRKRIIALILIMGMMTAGCMASFIPEVDSVELIETAENVEAVETVEGAGIAGPGEDVIVIYDLSADTDVSDKSSDVTYTYTGFLQDAGATFRTVDHEGNKSVHVTGRTGGNWRGLDVKFDALQLQAGVEYTMLVQGRVDGNIPHGMEMVLCAIDSYRYLDNPAPNEDGSFELLGVVLADAAFLSGNRGFRIMTNNEGEMRNFFVDQILITAAGGEEAPEEPVVTLVLDVEDIIISFTAEDMAAAESRGITVSPNDEVDSAIVYDIVNFDGDGAALHVWRKTDSASYAATPNGVRIAFDEPLPLGGRYYISAWFYVPEEGNALPGKGGLIGPSILINGNSASNAHKSPTSADAAGIIVFDEWTQVSFETAPFLEPIEFIDLRFYTNDFATHAETWYIDNIEINLIGAEAVIVPEWDFTLDSLAEAYKDYFLVGNIMEPHQIADADTTAMFVMQYNAVTAENAMKPSNMSPSKGEYTFDQADLIVDWAEENNLAVIGHALVWHSQNAAWLVYDEDGSILTRAEARANMEDYIKNVAGHYAGRVAEWDVVNEAFTNSVDFSGEWRDGLRGAREDVAGNPTSPWFEAYANGAAFGESGADYIYDAFKFARMYDPHAVLYYNDFNDTEFGKSTAIAAMVMDINNQWLSDPDYDGRLLIEGIGMQGHYNTTNFDIHSMEEALLRYIATGAVISITELDITVGRDDPYPGGTMLSLEDEIIQGQMYAQIFALAKEYADSIERITIWGKADPQSWRSGRLPLMFDSVFAPKGAFFGALNPDEYFAQNPLPVPLEPAVGTAHYGSPDGLLHEDWQKTRILSVSIPAQGDNPSVGMAQVMWDENYLYVRMLVTDRSLNNTNPNAWEQDSAEIFVSETAERSPSYFASPGGGQYRVSYENRFTARSDSMMEGVITDAFADDNGFAVYLAIPFREITPENGHVITFDIQINDATDGARTGQSTWSDPDANGYNSSVNWGELTFIGR